MTNPRRMQMAASGVSKCTPRNGNEVLLIHSDDTDGSTTFTDSIGTHTIGRSGSTPPVHDTAQSKWGGSSILGQSSGYLTIAAHTDFNFGSGLWSVDFWWRSIDSSFEALVLLGNWDCALGPVIFHQSTDGDLTVSYNTSEGLKYNESGSSTAIDTGDWVHIAAARTSATTLKAFVNGVEDTANAETIGSSTTMLDVGDTVRIGHFPGQPYDFNGWIDEVRIIKGAAPWTGNFDPPEAPYC